ncbi:MAG: glutathione S-transferase family protein, partial [Alphaproteobacteria bacterium]|nr:glutathione S-transferase family protein [Alphaproteobacteria bacterium]
HALHEAAAIMLYLADHHGLEDMAPLPGDPLRGIFLSKFWYFTNDVQPCIKRLGYPERYSLSEGDTTLVRRHARERLIERLGVLEQWLTEHGPWHLGERFSLADLHLALWAAYGIETTSTIVDMFPAIGRVRAGVLERPRSGPLLQDLIDLMDGRRVARPIA